MITPKNRIYIPYSDLEDAKHWSVGKSYRIKMVIKQVASEEKGASFEIVDANSLEPDDKGNRFFLSEGGSYKG